MANITKIFGVAEKAMEDLFKTYPNLIRAGQTVIGTASQLAIASSWLEKNGHDHSIEKEQEK